MTEKDQGAPSALTDLMKECPHGKVLICMVCRPPSKEMVEMAERVVAQEKARTTPAQGGPCPCGRGPATSERRGLQPTGRYECEACVEDSFAAAMRFIMDDSFGGP